jgi:UDP-3-O-[3-hydroxymyristoyl] N-acetylglucosamine deacetylase
VIKIGYRPQRSLARSVEVSGQGFITGAPVTLRFFPAAADTGIVFTRIDQPHAKPIPALADCVTGTQRRTTLGRGANQVTLVEHVLAALAGMRIDNCMVELNGVEPPGLDGSANRFVDAIVEAGIVLHRAQRPLWTISEPVILRQGKATLSYHPAPGDELRVSYMLDYGPRAPIAPQAHTETITPDRFQHAIAPCRTFVLEEEAHELQRQGVGRHLTAAELLVFGPSGLIDNKLRYLNEPARHKILDLIGDLALSGMSLTGRIVAFCSGHPLNVEMAKTLVGLARQNGSSVPMRAAA